MAELLSSPSLVRNEAGMLSKPPSTMATRVPTPIAATVVERVRPAHYEGAIFYDE